MPVGIYPRPPLRQRLSEKQIRDPLTNCLLFTGGKQERGYGHMTVDGRRTSAHRVAAFLAGIILSLDDPRMVCHHCDNPSCTEPEHLYAGDAFTNIMDAMKRGHYKPTIKTHCKRGHKMEGDNLAFKPTGERYCIVCVRIRYRESRMQTCRP